MQKNLKRCLKSFKVWLTNKKVEQESGCLFYAIHKSRADSSEYLVLEQYQDQHALELHQKTEYYKRIGAQLAEHVAAAPDIAFFDSV